MTEPPFHAPPSPPYPTLLRAQLPMPVEGTSAVFDGTYVHIFGGRALSGKFHEYSARVVRYWVEKDTTVWTKTTFPTPRGFTAAVWTGKRAYVFGGETSNGRYLDEIVEYDPREDKLTVLPVRLPRRLYAASAVWDGTHAYIFGGYPVAAKESEILRFDPAAERIETLTTRFPDHRSFTSALWTGDEALVFGGPDPTTRIAHFDPRIEKLRHPNVPVWPALTGASCSTLAGAILIFGGWKTLAGGVSDTVFLYDPPTDTVIAGGILPAPRSGTSAVSLPAATLLFGGDAGAGACSKDILAYGWL